MAIAIEQPQPLKARSRLHISAPIDNCVGRQYRVSDEYWTHIVTINNGCVHCSCERHESMAECSHIMVVSEQENEYRVETQRRLEYCALFEV